MDVLSAKSYFISDDPFTSINSSYISGIIVLTIALLLLKEITRSNVVDKQYRKDFNQLYDNIKEKLIVCFEILMSDEENNNLIYLILLNRLKI